MRKLAIALSCAAIVAALPLPGFAYTNPPGPASDVRQSNIAALAPLSSTGSGFDCAGATSCVNFDGRYNLLRQSDDLTVSWVKDANVTVTANQCQGPNGLTLDKVDNTAGTASATVYQSIAGLVSSAGPWTVTFDVAPLSGTQVVSPGISIGTAPTSCACARSDGAVCSATAFGSVCYASVSVSSAVRVSITATATAATTGVTPFFHPASYSTTKGAACAGGAQMVMGATDHPYVPTGATTRTSVLLDSAGFAWIDNGLVPSIQRASLPTTAAAGAVGPLSDTNFYTYATTSDPLDASGDRWGCASFIPTSIGATQMLISNGTEVARGHYATLAVGGQFQFASFIPGSVRPQTTNLVTVGGLNVGCWWRIGGDGGTVHAKLNLGTTAAQASATAEVPGTTSVLRMGRYSGGGTPFTGQILHVVQGLGTCPTPPSPFAASCEGWATYQMKRQFGQRGTKVDELSFTRATAKTHTADGNQKVGPLMTPDANTTSHVYFNGRSLIDAKANAWLMNGVVPQVPAINAPPAAGPYSAANSYQGPLTLGEWAGDWSATIVYRYQGTYTSSQLLLAKRSAGGTSGWRAYQGVTNGYLFLEVYDGASKSVSTVTPGSTNVANVVTFGKNGASCYVRLNAGASVSVACGTMVPAATEPLYIGKWAGGTSPADATSIHEFILSTTPYSDALHSNRYIEVTRKAFMPQTLAFAPPGVATVESSGSTVSRTSANVVPQSQTSCVANAVQTPWVLAGTPTCLSDVAMAPDNTTTMDEWSNTVNTDRPGLSVSVTSGTIFTGSVYVHKLTGSIASSLVNCVSGAPTACSCGVSDGSTCSTAIVGNNCQANWTAITPTTVRAWNTATCPATTSLLFYTSPGQYGASTGTARFWGAQVEAGSAPTPYIPTTTASVQRNIDQLTMPAPFRAGDAQWAVTGEFTPYARPWANQEGVVTTLWSAGTLDAANSARLEVVGTKMIFTVVDRYGTPSWVEHPVSNLPATAKVKASVADGRMALSVDGSIVATGRPLPQLSWQDTVPAIWSIPPSTLYVGSRPTATNAFDGSVKNIALERDPAGAKDVAYVDARTSFSVVGAPGTLDTTDATQSWSAASWNLIKHSEALDNAAWLKGAEAAITPDQAVSPAGTATADMYTATGNANAYTRQTFTSVAGQVYTASIYLKKVDWDWYRIMLYDGGNNYTQAFVNINTCTLGTTYENGTAVFYGAVATQMGNGWCRISNSGTAPGATSYLLVRNTDGNGNSTANVSVGTSAYMWGAQLVRGMSAAAYSTQADTFVMNGTVPASSTPVFNRGSSAGRRAVGPFTDNVYLAGSSAADPLDSTGDRWGCVAFNGYDTSTKTIFGNGLFSADGYSVGITGSGNFIFYRYRPGGNVNTSSTNAAINGLNVACWWSNGNNLYSRLNGGPVSTVAAAGAEISAAGRFPYLGRYDATTFSYPGKVYEIVQGLGACPDTSCMAFASRMINGALSQGDALKPLFGTPAGSVMHLKGNDYTGGLAWDGHQMTLNRVGAVGYSDEAAAPGELAHAGYGPFSDANYLSFGSGNDALDASGDRWGCVTFVPASISGTNQVLVNNGVSSTAGHTVQLLASTGVFRYVSSVPGAVFIDTPNSSTANVTSVACYWRTGAAISVKMNLASTATNSSAGSEVPGTSYQLRIGRYEQVGASFNGSVLSVVQGLGACPPPPAPFAATCEGWATYQQSRVLGHLVKQGQPLSVTRATPQTYLVGSTLYTTPSGVLSQEPEGTGIWRTSINYALQSQTSCVANAAQTPWSTTAVTCASDAAVSPDGTTTMDAWTSTGVNGLPYQLTAIPSTNTVTASVWASKASAGPVGVWAQGNGACGSITNCVCGTSDGRACTASIAATNCRAQATIGTTPVRIWATGTCATATIAATIALVPGDYGVSTGTANFWGAQIEPGLYPTPYVATTTTTVQRNASLVSATPPVLGYANLLLHSNAFSTAPWAQASSTLLPDGFVVLNQAVPQGTYQGVAASGLATHTFAVTLSAAASMTGSIGIQTDSGAATIPNGSCVAVPLTTTPTRFSFTKTSTYTSVAYARIYATSGCSDGSRAPDGTRVYASNAQLTQTATQQPYVGTTTAIGYGGNRWCACANVARGQGHAWSSTDLYPQLWDMNQASANGGGMFMYGTFVVTDSAGVAKQITAAIPPASATRAKFAACNDFGNMSVWINGARAGGAPTGTGTGLWSMTRPTLAIGYSLVNSLYQMDGHMSEFKFITTANHLDCGQGY